MPEQEEAAIAWQERRLSLLSAWLELSRPRSRRFAAYNICHPDLKPRPASSFICPLLCERARHHGGRDERRLAAGLARPG